MLYPAVLLANGIGPVKQEAALRDAIIPELRQQKESSKP